MSANVIIQFRRGTAAEWTSADPTLASGEVGLETDTNKMKIGDGSTAWTSLSYVSTLGAGVLNDISDVVISSAQDGDFLRWDGSNWINDAVNLGTDSVGDYVESLVAGTGVSLLNNSGEGATPTIYIGQDVGTGASVTFATLTTTSDVTIGGETTVGGHIIPDSDSVYDLGSSDNRFRDLYLSGTSIDLGGVEITSDGTDVTFPNAVNATEFNGAISGNLTGDVTGDLTGNADTATQLETSRNIQLSGDVTGNAYFDGTADITITTQVEPNSVALGDDTTGDYVQDLTAGTGVTVTGGTGESSSPTVFIGQDVDTGASVTFYNATLTNDLSVGGDATITGNLTVNGATTSISTTELVVEDNIIVLNSNATTASVNAGIEVERGTVENNVFVRWNETSDRWEFTNNGTDYYQLATSINDIDDVSVSSPSLGQLLVWDGSDWINYDHVLNSMTDVTITSATAGDFLKYDGAEWVNDAINLGTDTVGDYVESLVAGTGVSLLNNTGEGATPTVYIGQDVATGASVTFANVTADLVGDVTGNVTGDVTGNVTGNADTATALETARTIQISGDVAGSASFDGTGDINISATVQADSVALGTDTTGDYVESLVAGNGVTITNNSGEGATPTITLDSTANATFEDLTVNGLLEASHIHGDLAGPVYLHIKNTSGVTIPKNSPVYATGSVGASGATEVSGSRADSSATMPALGVTTDELANNSEGHAVILGVLENINTSSYSVNTVLYVGSGGGASGGGLTDTRPTAKDTLVQAIGRVVRSDASTGELLILGAGRTNDTPNDIDAVRISGDYYDFDTSSYTPTSTPGHTEGRLWYDSTNNSLRQDTSAANVDIALGQEVSLYVYNGSGSSIGAGKAVYFSGENSAIPTIELADASDGTKLEVAGVTKAAIANGAYGFVISAGVLLGVDTSGFSVGDRLHLSATSPGELTTTVPTYPNYAVEIAEVLLADDPGCFRLNIVSEVFDDLHVRNDARVDGDLTVGGDLTILGTQSTVSVNNLAVDDSWIYLNGGNTIETTSFTGSGLNDATLVGHFTGTSSTTYYVRIDSVGGGTGGVDTFEWSTDNFSTTEATGVDLDTDPIALSDGISVDFVATTGHTLNDVWSGTAAPVNIDLGIAGNYNDGTYAHTGFFRDTSDGYWKVFDSYTPEVDGDVNTAHASFNLADIQAANFRGDLVGNADTASTLETARTISLSGDVVGSVSFNGSGDVDITTAIQADSVALGTDTTGNYVGELSDGTGVTITSPSGEGQTASIAIGQDVATTADVTFNTVTADLTGDVTGNADTASALQTARTIQISGDVAGSASFDGSGDINISATVQADSVALGTDTTGNYTESVTGGTGVTVTGGTGEGNTPTVAIGQAVATSDDVTFNTVTISAAPTQASHAATKSYVDGLASGIDWHEAVDLATAAALPNSPVYDNGSSGVGATLTSSTQARLVVDGTNATTGDRVLVKNESTGANNGIYVVTAQGAAASSQWVLTRATDFDGGVTGEVVPGEAVLALNGSTNAKQGFVVTSTSDPHSIGSDAITFTQFTGTQSFTAGDGLTQTGNTLDVVTADSNRIVVNADSIDLATVYTGETTGASTSTIVSTLTVDDYGRITAMTTGTVHLDLNDLDDVTITGASSGEFLKWDGSAWINASIPEINTLNDVGNVNITSVADGEFLKWDDGTSKWINAAIPEINTLNDVGNVTITSATTGDILEWNGTAWVNTTLAFDDLSDVDMTSLAPSEGDVAYYDGSSWVPYPLTIQNAGGVSVSSETTGDILLYNGTNYVNTAHTLANITNVTLTSEADGEFLKYNGSAWVNASIPEINTLNDVGNVTITSASSGEVLQWNGTAWVNADILANTDLTGVPTAPTAATTTNTTQVATTAFVQQELAALVDSAPATLDTLNELAAALGDDANFSTTVTDSLALKAPLASPTFTGTVTLPAGTSMLHDYVTYSTNHTLVAGNEGQTLQFSAAGTLTVPANASVAFPIGTMITIFQTGTGTVTVAGDAGVTVNGAVGLKTREQWSAIVLHKRGTDTWLVTGDAKA